MAKRIKWWASEPPPALKAVMLGEDKWKGCGAFTDSDVPWLKVTPNNKPWFDSLAIVDRRGDTAPLAALLKSKRVPEDIQPHLADLLERHQLKKQNNRPRTPSYNLSDVEVRLRWAVQAVRERVNAGMLVADALQEESRGRGIPDGTLEDAYNGVRGATNRKKKSAYCKS